MVIGSAFRCRGTGTEPLAGKDRSFALMPVNYVGYRTLPSYDCRFSPKSLENKDHAPRDGELVPHFIGIRSSAPVARTARTRAVREDVTPRKPAIVARVSAKRTRPDDGIGAARAGDRALAARSRSIFSASWAGASACLAIDRFR